MHTTKLSFVSILFTITLMLGFSAPVGAVTPNLTGRLITLDVGGESGTVNQTYQVAEADVNLKDGSSESAKAVVTISADTCL